MSAPFGIFHSLLAPFRRRSGIEAGGGGRRWQNAPTLPAPQQSLLAVRGVTQNRASALYMNAPLARAGVEAWKSALVGGPGWQARAMHPNDAVRRQINDAFEAVIRSLLGQAARALVRDGEAFIRLSMDDDGAVTPRLIPADQVDPALTRDLGNGARIVAGIEFDADDRVVAYHILREAPGAPFATISGPVRVPAADVIHVFDPLFPGQVRGLSWLAPVALKILDRDAASDALLMTLKVQALMTGFIRDTEGGAAGFEGAAVPGAVNVSLEPGAMRILPPGADVTFSDPGKGIADSADFLRAQDREIAAGLGIPYSMLTGDLGEANYSSERVGLLEFRRRAKTYQRNLIEDGILRPLWRRWVAGMELAGRVTFDSDTDRGVRFVAPGWQWVDPQSEVAAEVEAIRAGLKSRAEVVASRGRDLDELDEEIAADTWRPMAPGGASA